jgi:hypothetical protein
MSDLLHKFVRRQFRKLYHLDKDFVASNSKEISIKKIDAGNKTNHIRIGKANN